MKMYKGFIYISMLVLISATLAIVWGYANMSNIVLVQRWMMIAGLVIGISSGIALIPITRKDTYTPPQLMLFAFVTIVTAIIFLQAILKQTTQSQLYPLLICLSALAAALNVSILATMLVSTIRRRRARNGEHELLS